MENRLLTTESLAKRWGINPLTLDRWRLERTGPKFLCFKTNDTEILYRIADIIEYERSGEVEKSEDVPSEVY